MSSGRLPDIRRSSVSTRLSEVRSRGVLESAGRRRAGMATRWRRNDQERLSRLEAGRPAPPGVRVGVRGCCPQPGSPRSRQAPSPRVVGPEVEPDGQVEDTGGQGCRAAAAVRAGVAVAGPLPGWRGSAAVVFVRPQARGGAFPDVVQADLLRGSSVGPGRSRTARSVDAASWRGALSCPGSRPAPLRLRPPKTPPHRADRSGDVPDVRQQRLTARDRAEPSSAARCSAPRGCLCSRASVPSTSSRIRSKTGSSVHRGPLRPERSTSR